MNKGRSGERYILGGANLDLGEFFTRLEEVSGVPRPRMKAPYFIAYGAACLMSLWAGISGREPRASLEGIRLIRHSFAFSSRKAKEELGYRPGDIGHALRDAVEWFRGRRAGEIA
jgi:dihydroflavonol-4-reductase